MHSESGRIRLFARLIAGAGVVLVALGGCVFSPRDAEIPGGGETSWVVPDHPTKVFENMKSGLESLTGTNYEKSLGTAFAFLPLPGDASQFPGVFDNWDKTREVEAMNNLIGDASSLTVDFSGLTPINQDISAAQYEGFYSLTYVSKAAADTSTYRGKARFDLVEGSKGWELLKWEDIEADPQYPTWGFLRAQL